MTLAEKKLQLIKAISELEDEHTLDKLLAVFPEKGEPQGLPAIPFPVKTNFNFVTVEEINSPDFVYRPVDQDQLVGKWPGDEPVEELINMLTK